MADVFEFNEARQDKIEEKKSRIKIWLLVGCIVVLGIVGLGIFSYYYNNRCFDDYAVQSKVPRNDTNNIEYRYYNKNLLKYSRSGISALDNKGNTLWNGGFEMKQPQVDVDGNYVVAADVGGKDFYVYSGQDEGTNIQTTLPIVRAKVAANGVAAVLTEDTDSNVLGIYNPYKTTDKLAVEIPTNIADEGYPLDFDISADGNSLVTAHLIVKGNEVENSVSFYNFTEVGQDQNTLVGGVNYGKDTISAIEFLGQDTVAVFRESGFTIFENMKKPAEVAKVSFPDDIKSLSYTDQYIAVVTVSGNDKQTLHILNMKGKEVRSRAISFAYSKMKLYEDQIIFSSGRDCHIVRMNGKEKFSYEFDSAIDAILPTEQSSTYTLIDMENINIITLKKK
ncbi:MAG: DUF5711 family protein [Eubacterium sp.]|nr:DUF5711 family protein [Eubacterium sp.]